MSRPVTRLLSLEIAGLPGRLNQSLSTTAPIYVSGPNTSGKTSLLNAASDVISGPHGGGMRLLGSLGDAGRIAATFEHDGTPISVSWSQGDKAIVGRLDGKKTGARNLVKALAEIVGPAGSWSARDYSSLSGPKRTAWLGETLYAGSLDIERVREACAEAGATPEAIEDLRGVLDTADIKALWPLPEDGLGYLDRVIDIFGAARRARDASLRAFRGSIEEDGRKMRETQDSLPPLTTAHWTAEADRLEAERVRMEAMIARVSEVAASSDRIQKQMADASDRVQSLQRDVEAATTRLDAARAAKVEAEARVEALSVEVSNLQDAHGPHADRRTRLADHVQKARAELESAQRRVDDAKATIASDDAVSVVVRAAVRVSGHVNITRKALSDLETDADTSEARSSLSELADACGSLPETYTAPETHIEALRAERDAKRAALGKAESLLGAQQKTVDESEAALNAANGQLRAAESSVNHEERAVSTEESKIASANSAIDTETETLNRLRSEMDALPTPEGSNMGADAMQEIVSSRDEARRNRDRLSDYDGMKAARMSRIAEVEGIEQARSAAFQVERSLGEAKAALFGEVDDPLDTVSGRLVRDVLGRRLVIRDGDVHIERDDGVSYLLSNASTAEGIVTTLAFEAAVRSTMPGWRAAIVDNVDAIQPQWRAPFLRALSGLFENGHLDNIIVAGWSDDVVPEGFNHHRLALP